MRTRSPLSSLLLFAMLVACASPLAARNRTVGSFYEEKRRATTREAFQRALQSLRAVAIGTREGEFLETMGMRVLARRGKPMDAALDGYLAEASLRVNRGSEQVRNLVFGYLEKGEEVTCVTVVLSNQRVREIRVRATRGRGVCSMAP